MHPRFLTPARKRGVAVALAALGMSLWLGAVMLRVTPPDQRDVSFPHLEARLIGIVAGGVLDRRRHRAVGRELKIRRDRRGSSRSPRGVPLCISARISVGAFS